jgi:hypothetical protein
MYDNGDCKRDGTFSCALCIAGSQQRAVTTLGNPSRNTFSNAGKLSIGPIQPVVASNPDCVGLQNPDRQHSSSPQNFVEARTSGHHGVESDSEVPGSH